MSWTLKRLERAVNGKSYSAGGLNIGQIQQYLTDRGVDSQIVHTTRGRSQFQQLLAEQLQRDRNERKESKTVQNSQQTVPLFSGSIENRMRQLEQNRNELTRSMQWLDQNRNRISEIDRKLRLPRTSTSSEENINVVMRNLEQKDPYISKEKNDIKRKSDSIHIQRGTMYKLMTIGRLNDNDSNVIKTKKLLNQEIKILESRLNKLQQIRVDFLLNKGYSHEQVRTYMNKDIEELSRDIPRWSPVPPSTDLLPPQRTNEVLPEYQPPPPSWRNIGEFGWDSGLLMISDIEGIYQFIEDKQKENRNYQFQYNDLIWGPRDWNWNEFSWHKYIALNYNVVILGAWGNIGFVTVQSYTDGVKTEMVRLSYDPKQKELSDLEYLYDIKWNKGNLFLGDPEMLLADSQQFENIPILTEYKNADEFFDLYPKLTPISFILDKLEKEGYFGVYASFDQDNNYQQIVLK